MGIIWDLATWALCFVLLLIHLQKKKTKEPLFLGDVKLEYVDKLFRILFAWKNFCEYPALSLPSLQAI